MTERDFVLESLREWIAAQRLVLEPQGAEFEVGEHLDGAGNDPIAWVNIFMESNGARLALWRAGEMELELADLDTCETLRPTHFSSLEGFRDATVELLSWISTDRSL